MNYIITGLGFGDEGKGSTVDAVCRQFGVNLVVRYNGGAQPAHNVVLPDNTHHTFSQFGSNSFIPGSRTFLSEYVMVNPISFIREASILGKKTVLPKVFIDTRALVTTPYHIKLNYIREKARGCGHHGTTGMGIGETVLDSLARPTECMRISDLVSGKTFERLSKTRDYLREEARKLNAEEEFDQINFDDILFCFQKFIEMPNVYFLDQRGVKQLFDEETDVVFEGAQGVLLDENYGFHPHTTWSKTTPVNAKSLCKEYRYGETKTIGVIRSYHTRHGRGPFPTESSLLNHPEIHNDNESAPGNFRLGYFDLSLLKYAVICCGGIDLLAMNHVDCISDDQQYVEDNLVDLRLPNSIEEQEENCNKLWNIKDLQMKQMPKNFPEYVADSANTRLLLKGYGMSHKDKKFMGVSEN
jgi:adenylosuccinate synthase